MANTVNIRKLVESPDKATFYVYLESDGLSGELDDQVFIDPTTDFEPPLAAGMDMVLWECWYEVQNFTVQLGFETVTGVQPAWTLTPGVNSCHKWFKFGGIPDKSGQDATGRLVLNTVGFITPQNQGTIVVTVRKNRRII